MAREQLQQDALLQQIALSLTNGVFAIDQMLRGETDPGLDQVRAGLEMIRDNMEATAERIYDSSTPVFPLQEEISASQIRETIARFNQKAA